MVSFSFNLVIMLSFLVLGLMFVGSVSANGCEFPATYNFGDPSLDTGGISAASHRSLHPMVKLSLDIQPEDFVIVVLL